MKRNDKTPADPELTRRIQDLIRYKGGGYNEHEVADIIENGLKLLKDLKDTGDVRVIQTALRELRYAFRLFAPVREQAEGIHLRLTPAPNRTARNINRRLISAKKSFRRKALHGHHGRGSGHHAGGA